MINEVHPIAPEELMAYLDGELSPERASSAAAHVESCAECRTIVEDLRGLSKAVTAWEVDTNANGNVRIMAALDAWEKQQSTPANGRKSWMPRLAFSWKAVPVYVVTVLALGMVSIRFIGSSANMALSQMGDADSGREKLVTTKPPAAAATKSQHVGQPILEPGLNKDSKNLARGEGDELQSFFSVDGLIVSNQQSVEVGRMTGFAKVSGEGSTQATRSTSTSASLPAGPMIIRTAEVSVIAKDFGQVRTRVEQIVTKHRGYIGSLQASGATGGGRTLQASLRIPSDQLDGALAEIKTLGRVQSESQNGQEVTARYVDLQARLSNSRNTERRLIDLLQQRTGKLSDVLEVENELARVRGEIEQMEAERKSLLNQVSFSTLNARITEDYQAQLQVVPPSTSTRLINAAVEGYRSMVDGILSVALFLLSAAPSLILWAGILFFPARFAWKRLRRVAE
jgi:hypothetical protein